MDTYKKGKKMAKELFIYQENWNTRYGKSPRIVVRNQGRFVDNVSKRQMKAGERQLPYVAK
jgi:hypothetical protein